MRNEDYFEYMKGKSFEEKLRAFGNACESMTRNSYQACDNCYGKENQDYYRRESHGQSERANWLFQELLRVYEER